jgi:plastocyanin
MMSTFRRAWPVRAAAVLKRWTVAARTSQVPSVELAISTGRTCCCGKRPRVAACVTAEVEEADVVRRRGVAVVMLRVAGCAAVTLLAVSACAPSPGGPAATRATAPASGPTGSTHAAATGADCTKAKKVAIVENTSGTTAHRYSFSPGTLTVQRGGFLAITNRSDKVHALITTPDAGLVTSVLDLDERQVVQFPKAGTFTVESAAAAHRAALHVTVAGESGCGVPEPTLTMTDGNSFAPTHLSVPATQNFTVVNKSGAAQTVTCAPDPGGNRDHSRFDRGETQILAIDKPGRYTCSSLQHPAVKAIITVTG